MNYLKGKKNKIILYSYITALLLLGIRLTFFLKDRTSDLVEYILFWLIALVSTFIIFMIILPTKMSFKEHFVKYKDLYFISIFIFFMEYIFIFQNQLQYTFNTFFSIIFVISCIVVISLLLPRKFKKIFMLFIFITFPLYLIFQQVYYGIFSDYFSFKEIVTINEGMEFAEGVIHVKFIHVFIAILIITALYVFIKYENDVQIKLNKKTAKIFYIPLLFFLLVNLNTEYPVKSARLHTSDHYLYYSLYNNTRFVSRFGGLNYAVRDFAGSIIPKKSDKADIKSVETFFQDNEKPHVANDYTGIFKDKNLVFIVAESFDYMALNETLTPNIYRLKEEGMDFQNHFVPVYPRTTCDSEIIYNTSLIPSVNDGPTCYMFNKNSYSNSLANNFNNEGYLTRAFHSNNRDFYTRYMVYEGFGYDYFYGQEDIGLSDTEKRYDSIFFEEGKDLILPDTDKFMSFVVTLSGHSPYQMTNLAIEKNYDTVDNFYGDSIPEEVKKYIAAQIEVDLFVGKLLDELETKGIMDDTVILFTTDHYPYTMTSETYEEYTGIKDNYLKSHSPLFIWSNDMEPIVVNKLTSSFDLLPTLSNLFGLDVDYTTYFGNDAFEEEAKSIVMYKDYSWYDGENYVAYGKVKDGSGNQDYINETTERIDEYFEIARKILRVNYFKK